MFSTYITLLVFLALLIVGVVLFHTKTYKTGSTLTAIYFSCLLYYCVIPFLIFIYNKEVDKGTYVRHILNTDMPQFLNGWFCVLLFFIAVGFSYRIFYRRTINKTRRLFLGSYYQRTLKRFILFCSIIGILCFALYIMAFGGILAMLQQSELVRSFSGDSDIPYLSKILVFPACFVVLIPCFMALYMEETGKNKFIQKFFFLIVFLLGLLFYVNNAGKTGILIYLISIAVPIISRYTRKAWRIVLIIGIIGVSFVGYLDNLFLYFSTGTYYEVEGDSFLDNISQFAYPSSNIMSLDGIVNISGLRLGSDFFTGIFSQIPGIKLPLSYEFTSQYYGGTYWREGGGTPTDSVTFGYMQFGYLGVLFWGIILGALSGWTDGFFKKASGGFGYHYLKATIIMAFFVVTTNSDPYIIIRNQFSLWVPLLFLMLVAKRSNNIKQSNYGR